MDYSIDCNTSEHKMYSIYAGVMILVFPFGIPLMYYFLLKSVKDKLDPGQERFTVELGSASAGLEKALSERT